MRESTRGAHKSLPEGIGSSWRRHAAKVHPIRSHCALKREVN